MGRVTGAFFAEEAFLARVPKLAVQLKCKNWGISLGRAEDIANEAASEAYRRSLDQTFEDSDHFRAWVTRTAINVAIDLLRRQSRTVPLSWVHELAGTSDVDASNSDFLDTALEILTEQERAILRLTFEDDLTLDEISDRLLSDAQCSQNARRLQIKRCRDRALDKLRSFLARCDHPTWSMAGQSG